VRTDAEVLDDLLDGRAAGDLPERLLELAAVAAELASTLAAPSLSRAERARILARAELLAGRRGRLLGALRWQRSHGPLPLVAAGAGGAAVTLALLGIALARRSAHGSTLPTVVRPAA
jgi:hypothetical protein